MSVSDESASNLSSDAPFGLLVFFSKKSGLPVPYILPCGDITIGSSKDADIRLKNVNETLQDIHCTINIDDNGIATLLNQAPDPVLVNDSPVELSKVLEHEDIVNVVGKKLQYLNKNLHSLQTTFKRSTVDVSSPKGKRQKKSPTFKTKTPTQRRLTCRPSYRRPGTAGVIGLDTPHKSSNKIAGNTSAGSLRKIVLSKTLNVTPKRSVGRVTLDSTLDKSVKQTVHKTPSKSFLSVNCSTPLKDTNNGSFIQSKGFSPEDYLLKTTCRTENGTPNTSLRQTRLNKSRDVSLNKSPYRIIRNISGNLSRGTAPQKPVDCNLNQSTLNTSKRNTCDKPQGLRYSMNAPVQVIRNKSSAGMIHSTPHSSKKICRVITPISQGDLSEESPTHVKTWVVSSNTSPLSQSMQDISVQSLRDVSGNINKTRSLSTIDLYENSPQRATLSKTKGDSWNKSLNKSMQYVSERFEEGTSSTRQSLKSKSGKSSRRETFNKTDDNNWNKSLSKSMQEVSERFQEGTSVTPNKSTRQSQIGTSGKSSLRETINKTNEDSWNKSLGKSMQDVSERFEEGTSVTPNKSTRQSLRRTSGKSSRRETLDKTNENSWNKSLSKSLQDVSEMFEEGASVTPNKSIRQSLRRTSGKSSRRESLSETNGSNRIASLGKLLENVSEKSLEIGTSDVLNKSTRRSINGASARSSGRASLHKIQFISPNKSLMKSMQDVLENLPERSGDDTPNRFSTLFENDVSENSPQKVILSKTVADSMDRSCYQSLHDTSNTLSCRYVEDTPNKFPGQLMRSTSEKPLRIATVDKTRVDKRSKSLSKSMQDIYENSFQEDRCGTTYNSQSMNDVSKKSSRRAALYKMQVSSPNKSLCKSMVDVTEKSPGRGTSGTPNKSSTWPVNDTLETSQQGITLNKTPVDISNNSLIANAEGTLNKSSMNALKTISPGPTLNICQVDSQSELTHYLSENSVGSVDDSPNKPGSLTMNVSSEITPYATSLTKSVDNPKKSLNKSLQDMSEKSPGSKHVSQNKSRQSTRTTSKENRLGALNKSLSQITDEVLDRSPQKQLSQSSDDILGKTSRKSLHSTPDKFHSQSFGVIETSLRRATLGKTGVYRSSRSLNQSLHDNSEKTPQKSVRYTADDLRCQSVSYTRESSLTENYVCDPNQSLSQSVGDIAKKYLRNTSLGLSALDITKVSPQRLIRTTEVNNPNIVRHSTESASEKSPIRTTLREDNGPDQSFGNERVYKKADTTPNNSMRRPTLNRSSDILNNSTHKTPNQAVYTPIVEDVSPATPNNYEDIETFKTPLNTPDVFQNMRKSILQSRRRRSSKHIVLGSEKRIFGKRPRESSVDGSTRSVKRRRMMYSTDSSSEVEVLEESYESIRSEDWAEVLHGDGSVTPNVLRLEEKLSVSYDSNLEPVVRRSQLLANGIREDQLVGYPQPSTSHSVADHEENISERFSTPTKQLKSPKSKGVSGGYASGIKLKRLSKSPRGSSTPRSQIASIVKLMTSPGLERSSGEDLANIAVVKKLMESPEFKDSIIQVKTVSTMKTKKSPRNKVTDVYGVKELMSTQKFSKDKLIDIGDVNDVYTMQLNKPLVVETEKDMPDIDGANLLLRTQKNNSPKNDLTNVSGVKKLMATPKVTKSPKNDLTNIRGIKRLMRTPKMVSSPKNGLTDVPGVKKLLATPKATKSPKNDLTDVKGIKRLMKTPKTVSSPSNDLTNVVGVKKLMATPKATKSPNNDLTNVRGVKKLMSTPKVASSPKNDLTDVSGVKELMASPKVIKSPKNDLTDVRGIKKIMSTPKVMKSPKNDYSDPRGIKKLMRTPRAVKSPKNDLTNVIGVKKLMTTPKAIRSPKNDLTDVRGVKKIMTTPKELRSAKNDLMGVVGVMKPIPGSMSDYINLSGVKELFTSCSPKHEDSFEKVFDRKPLRTYGSGRFSTSSIKEEGTLDQEVTEVLATSPHLEKWLEEQHLLASDNKENVHYNIAQSPVNSTRCRRKLKPEAANETGQTTRQRTNRNADKTVQNNRNAQEKCFAKVGDDFQTRVSTVNEHNDKNLELPKTTKRNKRMAAKSDHGNEVDDNVENMPVKNTRSRKKTVTEKPADPPRGIQTEEAKLYSQTSKLSADEKFQNEKATEEKSKGTISKRTTRRNNAKAEDERKLPKVSAVNATIEEKHVKTAKKGKKLLDDSKPLKIYAIEDKSDDESCTRITRRGIKTVKFIVETKETEKLERLSTRTRRGKDTEVAVDRPKEDIPQKDVRRPRKDTTKEDMEDKSKEPAVRRGRNRRTPEEVREEVAHEKMNPPIKKGRKKEITQDVTGEVADESKEPSTKKRRVKKTLEKVPVEVPDEIKPADKRRNKNTREEVLDEIKPANKRRNKNSREEVLDEVPDEIKPANKRRNKATHDVLDDVPDEVKPANKRRNKNTREVVEEQESTPRRTRRAKAEYDKYGGAFISESPLNARKTRRKN